MKAHFNLFTHKNMNEKFKNTFKKKKLLNNNEKIFSVANIPSFFYSYLHYLVI